MSGILPFEEFIKRLRVINPTLAKQIKEEQLKEEKAPIDFNLHFNKPRPKRVYVKDVNGGVHEEIEYPDF